jgi:galactose mutarotase-like enzyme
LLVSDENTKTVYPFDFEFRLKYTLQENQLELQYIVDNSGDKLLWFSVGGHPAFKVPIEEGLAYEDYRLVFNQTEDFARWPLSPEV